jgi:Tetratricopeptide repeat/FecR protein
MSGRSERAGELLREHVPVQTPSDLAARRSDLVRAVARDAGRVRRRNALLLVAGSALVVVAILIVVTRRPAKPSFTVGVEGPGEIGTYYAPAGGANLDLTFWDGSALTVAPHGGVRVAKIESQGAAVSLETGKVHVHVKHRPDTRWQFAAGPYTIRVTGTSFWVSWTPDESTLDLQMETGSVLVRGPGLDGGVTVDSGHHFVTRARAELSSTAQSPTAAAPPPSAREPAPSSPEPPSAAPLAEPPSWTALAARGEYKKIVQSAEARGMDASLTGSSLADLGALGDALRYTGRAALAQRALNTIRARYPGTPRAKSSAFLLGRMLDDSGNAGGALGWYDTYLSEAPGGSLAAEALGRRMLVLERLGRSAEATSAARTYLQRFPTGAYSARAEELVQQ